MSRFHGIVITMYFDEDIHPGRAHFHAEYAGMKASYDIRTLKPIVGQLPRPRDRLVRKWARQHQDELSANWRRARARQPTIPIDPLP